jgi:hypothetical protein
MKLLKFFSLSILLTLVTLVAQGKNQSTRDHQGKTQMRSSLSRLSENVQVTPGAANSLSGSGTPGQLAKWTGVAGSNTYVLGNSTIFEDKFGKVGIGTTTPTSLLTVAGMIETTLGGVKFPDGTVQTTAATAGLQIVFHNATLTGNGTQGSPLGVAVPLTFFGAAPNNSVLFVQNTSDGSTGTTTIGGDSSSGVGGDGVFSRGGASGSGIGGSGVHASGGNSNSDIGGTGVIANGGNSTSGSGGAGIFATGGSGAIGNGDAGIFDGDVSVTGNLSKGGGSFKIDHPLDPENKYLYHSFVESPDMMNIYNGNIMTDGNGDAVVVMPDYFEALNRDFRYQLTVIGQFAQAIVAEKIKGNQFRIKTNAPNTEVSWQVTGVRHDAFANKNRIPVEVLKKETERGLFLHPKAYGQAEEKGIEYIRALPMKQKVQQR